MKKSRRQKYLSKFKGKVFLLKLGGEVILHSQILESILKDVRFLMKQKIKVILVHGGGPQADALAKRLGHKPLKIEGRRVTKDQDLEIAKMLYGGSLNLDILSILKKLGIKGMRVSGLDGDLITAIRRPVAKIDYGHVGDIIKIHPKVIRLLLKAGYLPVVSPLAATKNGQILNINADSIATALAAAYKPAKMILFTNVEGVLKGKKHLAALTASDAQALIEDATITGGMAVKVENCLAAIEAGVKRVHIINGLSPHSLLKEVLTKKGIGTMIMSDAENKVYEQE